MNNKELFNELDKIVSILGCGLEKSCGACGLTRKDSVEITELRDSAVYAHSLLRILVDKIDCEEVEKNA